MDSYMTRKNAPISDDELERVKIYVESRISLYKGKNEPVAIGKLYAYQDVLEFIKGVKNEG